MGMSRLPFDTQTCTVVMGLYSEVADEVVLQFYDNATGFDGWRDACITGWVVTAASWELDLQTYTSGVYSYTRTSIQFTRIPDKMVLDLLVLSMLMVVVSWLGFLIDPAVVLARVALGIISILVAMNNYVELSRVLPPGVRNAWLGKFLMGNFFFNIAALMEQILVCYGMVAHKWLEEQRTLIKHAQTWKTALLRNRHAMMELLNEWDEDGNGTISRKEFRKGIEALGVHAPIEEVTAVFNAWDLDGDGILDKD